jgi:hypothetical protein
MPSKWTPSTSDAAGTHLQPHRDEHPPIGGVTRREGDYLHASFNNPTQATAVSAMMAPLVSQMNDRNGGAMAITGADHGNFDFMKTHASVADGKGHNLDVGGELKAGLDLTGTKRTIGEFNKVVTGLHTTAAKLGDTADQSQAKRIVDRLLARYGSSVVDHVPGECVPHRCRRRGGGWSSAPERQDGPVILRE